MALRQHQPIVARMLDEPSAGLHQPLLQAGQRPGLMKRVRIGRSKRKSRLKDSSVFTLFAKRCHELKMPVVHETDLAPDDTKQLLADL
jgi:hypothetical protein